MIWRLQTENQITAVPWPLCNSRYAYYCDSSACKTQLLPQQQFAESNILTFEPLLKKQLQKLIRLSH